MAMSITKVMNIKKAALSDGIKFMLISTLCFSAMQAFIKLMPQFNSFQHIFFRSLIGWILCVAWLLSHKVSLVGKNRKLLILRGVIGSASMFSFFFILTRIPFASSVALKYLSPIFTSIFAVLFLNEKIKPIQWLFFLLSFAGVLVLKGFDTRISGLDLSIGIISAIFGGLLYIVIRNIGDDDHPLVILHYFMLISAVVSFIIIFNNWKTPNLKEWAGLSAIGIVAFFAQNYFTKAIQSSEKVSLLSNLRYLEAGYAFLIGYCIFNETYNLKSFLGLAMIFLGLLLSLKYKSKQKLVENT
jgi:drug/metabolite transporter (DMT)-like permease